METFGQELVRLWQICLSPRPCPMVSNSGTWGSCLAGKPYIHLRINKWVLIFYFAIHSRSNRDPHCVQRFDWPGSNTGRLAPGFDISGCLKFVSVASEDGFCYMFDTRKPGGAYIQKLSRTVNSASGTRLNKRCPITDVSFHPRIQDTLFASSLEGDIYCFKWFFNKYFVNVLSKRYFYYFVLSLLKIAKVKVRFVVKFE